MNKLHFTALSLCLMAIGCTNDESFYEQSEIDDNGVVVLQERNAALPKEIRTRPVILEDKTATRAVNESGGIIGNSDVLLGYSYSIGNSILGDYENVISPVIDLMKVKEYGSDYITGRSLQVYMSERFSYSDYNSYESKLSQTKKVASGFQLNLGLFKLGRKKKTEETFKSELTSSQKVVYGELNLMLKNSSFNLQASDGARKFYARECLSPVFLRNLYSSTLGNILDTYGECILTGYITGGKACALYTGLSRNGSSSTSKETGMEKSIDASFSWKKNSVSGDFQFGKGNFNYESSEYNMEQLYTKMWIYGGDPVGLSMNSAENLVNINFDLAPWVASLSDSKKHTIIDITDNGLYPLSAFVIEENFKKRLDATTSNLLEKYPSFVEPHIEIMRVFERYSSSNEALYDVVAVLFTRQGDRIVLRSGNASTASDAELRQNENATVFSQKALNIKTQKQNFYELRISSNSVTRLNPKIGNPLCIDLPKVNEANMYTYTNPRTGIQYINDTENKIAFSHYTDDLDGDWILDDYGIRSWVESLPTKSISMATLANSYRIIGL